MRVDEENLMNMQVKGKVAMWVFPHGCFYILYFAKRQ